MSGHNMVTWRDFEGVDGFGQATQQDFADLRKALVAGSAVNAPAAFTPGDGFALRVESLENTVKSTTFRMEHIKLLKAIAKIPAFNTVEEYNRVTSYGALSQGAFVAEGALPEETDATYERVIAAIKFMGTTRRVSHVMSLVKPAHGNVIAQETVAGTMYLLRQIEKALFVADSTVDAIEFDGLERLIRAGAPATHVIDLRGAAINEDNLVDSALTISNAPAFGMATDLHLNPTAHADLAKSFFPKARYDLMQKPDGQVGLSISGFMSPSGTVRFNSNVFLDDGGAAPTAAVGDADKRPQTPTLSAAPSSAAPPAGVTSLWAAGTGAHDAGAYVWQVTANSRFGASVPVRVPATGTFTTVATQSTSFGVTPAGGPQPASYSVYRTTRGGTSTARFVFRVANAAGAGATTIRDDNTFLPGTTRAFMIQQDRTNLALSQLAPMIRVPLATIDPSIRWMQLQYLTMKLYTPAHNTIIQNVGRSSGFVGTP